MLSENQVTSPVFLVAEDVVGQHSQGRDQRIGGELAGRQPLHIEIGFKLAVQLIAQAMGLRKGRWFVQWPGLPW